VCVAQSIRAAEETKSTAVFVIHQLIPYQLDLSSREALSLASIANRKPIRPRLRSSVREISTVLKIVGDFKKIDANISAHQDRLTQHQHAVTSDLDIYNSNAVCTLVDMQRQYDTATNDVMKVVQAVANAPRPAEITAARMVRDEEVKNKKELIVALLSTASREKGQHQAALAIISDRRIHEAKFSSDLDADHDYVIDDNFAGSDDHFLQIGASSSYDSKRSLSSSSREGLDLSTKAPLPSTPSLTGAAHAAGGFCHRPLLQLQPNARRVTCSSLHFGIILHQ
jgi:hypothetical protein